MDLQEAIPIQIKANQDGFILVPEHSPSFEEVYGYLQKRLGEAQDFFRSTKMTLDLRSRALDRDEILSIQRLLQDVCGAKLTEIRLADELSFHSEARERVTAVPSRPASQEEACPVVVRHTCRSGARIVSPSDCLVLGDVNPGAEIIALGDIVVFGTLRGLAHAGASGDRQARIWALSIEPNQLRIADLVAVPPRGRKPVPKRYELAEVRNDAIEVLTV